MNRGNGIFVAIIASALLAVVVFFVADFSAGKSFGSPQEVIDAVRLASQKDDLRGWCQCLTDESRDIVVADAVVVFSRQLLKKADTDEKVAQNRALEELFKQNGMTMEHLAKMQQASIILRDPQTPMEQKLDFAQTLLAPVGDRNSFAADLFRTILKSPGAENPLTIWKNAKLSEVQISGKTAQGMVAMEQGRPEKIFFRKQGDSWRIDLFPEDKEPPPPFQHP